MKTVSIVILNWNGTKDTLECLGSIGKLKAKRYTLNTIVVDNGSVKKFEIRNSKFENSKIKIIRNEDNLGFSGGNNVGIRHTLKNREDYIVILNNDTIVDKNLIDELLKIAESDKRVGIVVPKIYFAPGFEFHKNRYKKEERGRVVWYAGGLMDWKNVIGHHRGVDEVDHRQYSKVEGTDFASGCCMLVKREVFERVGLFDEKYFLYYEDNDLSMKARKAGFTIMFVPQAVLWHKNAASAHGSGSSLQDYYITRNRLLFGMRYAPFKSKLALLRESLGLLSNGRQWQRRAVFDFYLGKFGRGSYPV